MKLFESKHSKPMLLVFSHLRWDFVFQRPQHLMTRAAQDFEVVFIEEPIYGGCVEMWRERSPCPGVHVVQPLVPADADPQSVFRLQESLVEVIAYRAGSRPLCLWYDTPLAYDFSRWIWADVIVFDKMDELSAFAFAPPGLADLESEVMQISDLVFTGGASLHEAAASRSPAVHCFPSSMDAAHFGAARDHSGPDPDDQAGIEGPRMGFVGVIDERIDLALIADVAALRPDLQLIMVGPTAKIDPSSLPQAPNIHWLGPKDYAELPAYMAHWDLGWMPLALNEATRFISPTKTPEFLAAGLPLISTAIRDVVEPYGRLGLVDIVDNAAGAVDSIDRMLTAAADPDAVKARLADVDRHLSANTWDATWAAMRALIETVAAQIPAPLRKAQSAEVQNV
ncbi:glycosyltransferase [Hyphomonas sp.]|uniref:glycosyltransferase n=1 Tax=Hyphomonas sp. TaxID=87 RepID=UPI00391C5383